MEQWEREYYVSRIAAGEYRIKVFDKVFAVANPSRADRCIANEIYRDMFQECRSSNIMTCNELLAFMKEKGFWEDKFDEELVQLGKNVEELKVGLFERFSEDNAVFSIRRGLETTYEEINRLHAMKTKFDYLSCESIATSAKLRYLVGSSLRYPDYNSSGDYTEEVMNSFFANRISEADFREIARTDPWVSFWNIRENAGSGLFGQAAIDLTDEQRTLIMWSTFYDSVKEHSECPDEKIILDNDALDGWIIVQRRKAKAERAKSRLDGVGSKIKNSDEVFLMAKSADDIDEINQLNDKDAQRVINQRWKYIEQHKEVKEGHLPDTFQRLQQQCVQLERDKLMGRN